MDPSSEAGKYQEQQILVEETLELPVNQDTGGDNNDQQSQDTPSCTDDVLAWRPSGNVWKDAWFFVGPGWLGTESRGDSPKKSQLQSCPFCFVVLLTICCFLFQSVSHTSTLVTTKLTFRQVRRHATIYFLQFGGVASCQFMYRSCACDWHRTPS